MRTGTRPASSGAVPSPATANGLDLWRAPLAGLAVWAGLLVLVHLWGGSLNDRGEQIFQSTPPLTGRVDLHLTWASLPALALAVAAVALGPRLARRLAWSRLLLAAAGGALAWAVLLALTRGTDGLLGPVRSPLDYLHDVPLVVSPGAFLGSFVDRIGEYATHVRGHPPGMLLFLWSMDRIGLGGAGPAATLQVAGGAAAVPAALVALRELAGEDRSRRAAPFLVLLPAAIWVATSADAFFAGVGASGIALVVLATGRAGRRSDALALAGGLLLGAAMVLSYGLVLLWSVPLAVCLVRRRIRPLAIAVAGGLAVLAAFALAGFWWLDGLAATREQYRLGASRMRPYGYFLVANLAGFGLALGPAVAAGIATLRHRGTCVLVGSALVAVLLADLSGLSRGEVERIWLPFVPWVAVAAASLSVRELRPRLWLGLSAGVALAVQLGVRTPW